MWRGISLANKCLLMFGGAVVLIVLLALSVPWFRMNSLVDEGQLEVSRQLVDTWARLDADEPQDRPGRTEGVEHAGIRAVRLTLEEADAKSSDLPFVGRAVKLFRSDPLRADLQSAAWNGLGREYRYARAVRTPFPARALEGVILLE